jgi:hypothetical protein
MNAADRVRNGACGQRQDALAVAGDDPARAGVSLSDLEPLTTLHVRTANSLYRIIVLRGTTLLIRGGRSFPEATRGELFSFGINVLRFGWIGVGLRMEIHAGDHCIVTSPVRAFTVEPHSSAVRVQ